MEVRLIIFPLSCIEGIIFHSILNYFQEFSLTRGIAHVIYRTMFTVKIHKDQVNQFSQTRARLEACLESIHTGLVNRTSESNNESFGSFERTPKSCIQSDVFVCSFLLKLVCSFLLKLVCSFLLKEPRLQYCTLNPRDEYHGYSTVH
jgi:hypothetical protein